MSVEKGISPIILDYCNRIAKDNKIRAICIYGSRVSGYARNDSDYDVLLILRDYSNGIKYFYETIDEKLFSVFLSLTKKTPS